MKKGIKIILPILLVIVMIATSLLVFVATTGAADEEASLVTRTVEVNSTYGYVTTLGSTTSEAGAFSTLLDKLANLTPATPTRYKLTLNRNITLEKSVTLNLGANAEVIIDLAGHTITSLAGGDAITVSGDGKLRLFGNITNLGANGKVIYTQTAGSFLKIAAGSTAHVFMRHVDLDITSLASGEAVSVLGGAFTMQSANVIYNPSVASDVTVIGAKNSIVELKDSLIDLEVNGTLSSAAIKLDGAEALVLNSTVKAFSGVDTASASNLLLVDATITAYNPIKVASSDTKAYILGGYITTTGTSIVDGGFNKENIVFYYGSGVMKVVGEDPAAYTVQESTSFEKKGDVWVMSASSTNEAMLTKATLGSAPTVAYDNYFKSLTTATSSATPTKSAVAVVATLKDSSYSTHKQSSFMNEWQNAIISFNGKTITQTAETTSANFDVYGNPYIRYSGVDKDGNLGKLIVNAQNNMFIRTRTKGDYLGANEYTSYTFENAIVEATKCDITTGNYLFAIQQGEFKMSNVDFIYTGTKFAGTAVANYNFIGGSSSAVTNTTWYIIDNVRFRDVSTTELMSSSAIGVVNTAFAVVKNCSFEGFERPFTVSAVGTKLNVINSTVNTTGTPFIGSSAKVNLYNTTVTIGKSGIFSEGGVSPVLNMGDGKCTIYTGDADLSGSYGTADGTAIIMQNTGVYVLMNAKDIVAASITMPAIFQDGMVLQRNKNINIFGYCETEGATVEVTLAGKTATATVKNGEWCATFEPMGAMFNQTIEVRQTGNVSYNLMRFTNVNIGEIWVMSGQSNGNLTSRFMEDCLEYADIADTLTNVRAYTSSLSPKLLPQRIGSGTWYELDGDNVKAGVATAIGTVVAIKLAAELGPDVPVAIMHMARGAAKIKTFIDIDTIREISPSAAAEYDHFVKEGTLPTNSHSGGAVASVLYNNLFAPVENFSVAGVLWYQGEGDTGGGYFASTKKDFLGNYEEDKDNCYTEFFYALESSLRKTFGNDSELPFYVMQLSPFLSSSYETANVFNLKIEQFEMCKNEPNTHLVSLATDGTVIEGGFFGVLDPDITSSAVEAQGFIHPLRKSTIGVRCADMILNNSYGIKYADVYTYPTPVSATIKGGVVTVEFDSDISMFYGDTVLGFELYNGTKWVKATGRIEGKKVILAAEGVTSATRLRYGCGETLMELGDGTIIEVVDGKYTTDKTAQTITVTYNGQQYVIHSDTTDMVRTLDYGNITNASGVPMPIFAMDIVAE